MTLNEIKSIGASTKQVHFCGVKNNTHVQCDILSMKKFRRLNEILAEKDLIIQHLQDSKNETKDDQQDDTGLDIEEE